MGNNYKIYLNACIDGLGGLVEGSAVLERMSKNDYTTTVDGNLAVDEVEQYQGDFIRISNSLNIIIASLNMVLGEIEEAAVRVSSGSRQVSAGSQGLSQCSTEQASVIQELSASITEIIAQTKQNAINTNQASQLAEKY